MASVHLLSSAPVEPERDPYARLDLAQMQEAAALDRFRVHSVTDDPEVADLVVFVETISSFTYRNHYFQQVRKHPIYRAFPEKSYLFAATDKMIPFLPGVYASVERRWYSDAWTRSGFYPGVKERPDFHYDPGQAPTRLFSFMGSAETHPVRRRIMELEHPDALLVDTRVESAAISEGKSARLTPAEFQERYRRSVTESAFVLCPRGAGASTFRLFETMMLGRVPVIVSDQWVPPQGPDWSSMSVRVEEGDVDSIPALLEATAAEAQAMGRVARGAWVDWFSEDASFHRTVEWCLDLERFASAREGARRYRPYVQMLRPYHAARVVVKQFGHGRASPPEGHSASPPGS